MFNPIKAILEKGLAFIHTRLDLISTELEEQREHLKEMILLGLVSLFFLSLGVLLLTLFIVAIFWDTYRLYVLGGFALLYLAAGVTVGLMLRKKANSKPRFLSATLSELAKDRERLRS